MGVLESPAAAIEVGDGVIASWLHIQLNTLLPHCRYQTSDWLSDTIHRLLDEYESGGSKLPFFKEAMLVIARRPVPVSVAACQVLYCCRPAP